MKKIKTIIQSERSECGLACLSMVMSYHGFNQSMLELRTAHGTSNHGLNFERMSEIAYENGFVTRALKAPIESLADMSDPAILHWNMSHFVVLESVKAGKYIIHDPAKGKLSIDYDELSKCYTGVLLELHPGASFKIKETATKIDLSILWSSVSGIGSNAFQLLSLTVMILFFTLLAPFYVQSVIDSVIPSNDTGLLSVIALGFGFIIVFQQISTYLRNLLTINISSDLSVYLSGSLYRHLMTLPISFFERRDIGDISSRFDSLNRIRDFFTIGFVESIIDGITAVFIIVILFYYNALATLVLAMFTILYVVIRLVMISKFRALNEKEIRSKAIEKSKFIESIANIFSIKSLSHESKTVSNWSNCNVRSVNDTIKLQATRSNYQLLNSSLSGIENIIVIYMLASSILTGESTIGIMTAYVAYKRIFTQRFTSLFDKIIEYKMLHLHLERVADIALTKPTGIKRNGVNNQVKEVVDILSLSLSDISCRIDGDKKNLFSNVNIEMKNNEYVAIVGRSGCGKSTLVKLLLGLYEYEGVISVNGVNIEEFGWDRFRKKVSVIVQDDKLFSGSVIDNITMFDESPDMKFAQECCEKSHVHKVIMKKNMGYRTFISPNGNVFSQGEKQRILLARALYKKPQILIMDESTSGLDMQTERLVNESIDKLNIIRVIIAHRPQTIKSASRVFRLTVDGLVDETSRFKADENFSKKEMVAI